ncbi:ribonuclease H-like domain-containing protein [Infundibulicybe gibba]|nr:ribonuclease H-like domain-containing protein [Infundibulicybe gibba]
MSTPRKPANGSSTTASSNWLALKKNLPEKTHKHRPGDGESSRPRKRQKMSHHPSGSNPHSLILPSPTTQHTSTAQPTGKLQSDQPDMDLESGESRANLQRLISGELTFNASQQSPGKYLALDCEMVGVGPKGAESSLARVSLVNYYGAVQLDEFVRQRERVVDYRTQFSGIRPTDLVDAKTFEEVQKRVAELLKDRILVGHAVHNDLKALLLSHPRPSTRDTQIYAHKHKLTRSNRIALRNLVMQELGVKIQEGEHSSVTDARATMAVYRLHKKEWEKPPQKPTHNAIAAASAARKPGGKKQKANTNEKGKATINAAATGATVFPGGGRKGISSGISIIVHQRGGSNKGTQPAEAGKVKKEWWKEVG